MKITVLKVIYLNNKMILFKISKFYIKKKELHIKLIFLNMSNFRHRNIVFVCIKRLIL